MRLRLFALLTVLVLAVAGLSACSGGSHSEGDAKFPAVSGDFGKKPQVDKGAGEAPKQLASRVLHKGKGAEVGENATVAVDYLGQTWDGKVFDTTFKDGASPLVFSLNQVVKGWKQGLAGKHVGDRVQLVIPPDLGYGDKAQTNQKGEETIPANSTLVFVVDIHDQIDPSDTTALQPGKAKLVPGAETKLPAGVHVSGPLGKKPQVNIDPGAKLPQSDTLVVLAEGTGEPLGPDDYAALHVTAKPVQDGGQSQVSSTWDAGAMQLTQGPIGHTKQFLGIRVGSRAVLLRPAPPQQASSQQPPTVFVIDYGGKLSAKR